MVAAWFPFSQLEFMRPHLRWHIHRIIFVNLEFIPILQEMPGGQIIWPPFQDESSQWTNLKNNVDFQDNYTQLGKNGV